MQIVKRGTITEIDGKVRVEPGPRRVTATATKELLDDHVTASHYQVGLRDALGKVIELGKPMTYVDWNCSARAHYVYVLEPVKETLDGKPVVVNRWMPKGSHPTPEAALSQATTLAAEIATG